MMPGSHSKTATTQLRLAGKIRSLRILKQEGKAMKRANYPDKKMASRLGEAVEIDILPSLLQALSPMAASPSQAKSSMDHERRMDPAKRESPRQLQSKTRAKVAVGKAKIQPRSLPRTRKCDAVTHPLAQQRCEERCVLSKRMKKRTIPSPTLTSNIKPISESLRKSLSIIIMS